jgi:hypothetical protein
MTSETDLAFYVGRTAVQLRDVAKAIAVHEANGEAMNDQEKRRVLVQDSCDILNRAHRYAKDRESTQTRDRK